MLHRSIACLLLVPVALAACSKTRDAGPPVPASVQVTPGSIAFTALGQTQQFTATVRDAQGTEIAGAGVTWSSTNTAIVTVNSSGLVTAEAVGSAQVRATAGSVVGSAPASVGIAGAYNIEVRPLTALTPSQAQAFTNAAARWMTIVTGDVAAVPVTVGAGTCGTNSPALNETVDDIIIFATIQFIDGPGAVLGQAGPCYIRTSGFLPIVGRMRFDSADVAALEAAGRLQDVILHEMGHVLGYGTIWSPAYLNLLADSGLADPHFTGAQAIAAFDSISNPDYGGLKVPVENTGGPGTRDAHWRESVFTNELMTGFIAAGANPLSVVSVTSMADLGYVVNKAASDPFVYPLMGVRAAESGPALELKDDVWRGPIRMVDARGRVVGLLRQ